MKTRYEDVQNALGDDLMSFMSEMLSEPENSEETDKKTPPELSPREQQLIDYLEKDVRAKKPILKPPGWKQ